MPTYEYSCELCGHQLEIFQSMNDERLVTCPACSKDGLKRLIGRGAGIIFKGTGFYETDYKRPSDSGSSSDTSTTAAATTPDAGS